MAGRITTALFSAIAVWFVLLSPVPAPAAAALEGFACRDGRVTFTARGVALETVLQTIAGAAGIDIRLIDPATQPVWIKIVDKPLEQALRSLLRGVNHAVVYGSVAKPAVVGHLNQTDTIAATLVAGGFSRQRAVDGDLRSGNTPVQAGAGPFPGEGAMVSGAGRKGTAVPLPFAGAGAVASRQTAGHPLETGGETSDFPPFLQRAGATADEAAVIPPTEDSPADQEVDPLPAESARNEMSDSPAAAGESTDPQEGNQDENAQKNRQEAVEEPCDGSPALCRCLEAFGYNYQDLARETDFNRVAAVLFSEGMLACTRSQ